MQSKTNILFNKSTRKLATAKELWNCTQFCLLYNMISTWHSLKHDVNSVNVTTVKTQNLRSSHWWVSGMYPSVCDIMHFDSKLPTFQTNLYLEDEGNRFLWNVMHLSTWHHVTSQETDSITKLLCCRTEGLCLKQNTRHECHISFCDNYV
jgi:hypothetical protein